MRRSVHPLRLALPAALAAALGACVDTDPARIVSPVAATASAVGDLDTELRNQLASHGFTGRVAHTLEARLGRRIDRQLADIGRMLWFDPISGLNDDNACAGCHSPTHGWGDSQPIAIGIDNNGVVGPARTGPRNQRRSPSIINTAFFPTLMWNSRFHARSGDPFDNRDGFVFPEPEASSLSYLPHLLTAQAFIPPTERVEAAGFAFPGDSDDIRAEVLRRLNDTNAYRQLFARVFPEVKAGGAITFDHFGHALAEFELTQVYADAPIDRYARGISSALSPRQKYGAVLFFGRAGCVRCHAVAGSSNEMFSDFRQHVAGIPQVTPSFTNVAFDGPGTNEDFGLEQVTGDPADRYAFRTSPLRNVALQAAFMHNGAFVRLEDAIRYHMDARAGAASYTTTHLPPDLRGATGPMQPVLDRLDPLLREPVRLSETEFDALVDFVRTGLLDPAARPQQLRRFVPERLPSGRANFVFHF
ncbi:MAG TPA: cytochrome c peroxidase [Longimicrobiales bacterium]